MNLIACDGVWQADADGFVRCVGVLSEVTSDQLAAANSGGLSIANATDLAGATLGLFAVVFVYRALTRLFP